MALAAAHSARRGERPDAPLASHFHSDHYGGLTRSWTAGPIYCSAVTANLVKANLGVSARYVVPLPMDTPCTVDGVTVTLMDANQ